MIFDEAFDLLLGHEGGYSDHAADPGGKTHYGVTEVVARQHGYQGDMRDLPLDLAKQIYRRAYWDAIKADELPDAIRYAVFDAAVNSGTGQAVKWLQRAVRVPDDGVVGPKTVHAAHAMPADEVLRRMLAQRLRFMTELHSWYSFSRGWARRVADLLEA